MDQTRKPLVIPPQFALYAEKHEIFEFYQRLLNQLIINKPNDPIEFMIDFIKKDVNAPSVIILGPPASGKMTIARLLNKKLRSIILTKESIFENLPNELIDEFDGLTISELKPYHWAKLLKARIKEYDCTRKGWILVNFPETREQALAILSIGIIPKHCIFFEAEDLVLIERSAGKRIDKITGDIYHTTFDMPSESTTRERLIVPLNYKEDDIVKRLKAYHRHAEGIMECLKANAKTFNTDQPKGDVFYQVHDFVTRPARSVAPIIPRILIIGPRGCGKQAQAMNLAIKYDIAYISMSKLINEAISNETMVGLACKPYVDKNTNVPESLVMQLLRERLGQLDCVSKGWVLHGFPKDRDQALALDRAGFVPNRVFFLNIANDSVLERLTLKYMDPITGEEYHLLTKPPLTQEIRNRLKQRPRDTEPYVSVKLTEYYNLYKDLVQYYDRTGIHINADQDPKAVFETIEFGLVNCLSDSKVDKFNTVLNTEAVNDDLI